MNLVDSYFKRLGAELRLHLAETSNTLVLIGYFLIVLLLYFLSPQLEPGKSGFWFSFVPPLTAVVFAFISHRLIESLLIGILSGKLLLWISDGRDNPITASAATLYSTVSDDFNQKVLVFIVVMLSMITVVIAAGGLHAIIELLARRAKSGKSAQIITAIMGFLIFIDDYANTMIVGSAMRPVTDRFKISREKLAFLVDATAAPIAGLAIISTWIGYEVGLFGKEASTLGYTRMVDGISQTVSGYGVFLDAIAFRFYCWMMLIFVLINVLMDRDFGSMHLAQKRALKTGILRDHHRIDALPNDRSVTPGSGAVALIYFSLPLFALVWASSIATLAWQIYLGVFVITVIFAVLNRNGIYNLLRDQVGKSEPETDPEPGHLHSAWTAIVPFLALFGFLFVGLWKDGGGGAYSEMFSFSNWINVISKSENNVLILAQSGVAGLTLAILCAVLVTKLPAKRIFTVLLSGAKTGFLPMTILVLAWALKKVCDDVQTGAYLANLLGDSLSLSWFPAAVFVIAGLVAFSTGTSWGTMAILIPIIAPIAFKMDGGQYGLASMICLGAILDGAILGDHCSPISDTTILSSLASSSDHLDHVKTQMPYALTVGALAIFVGYLPAAAFGASSLVLILLAGIAMVVIFKVWGKPATAA